MPQFAAGLITFLSMANDRFTEDQRLMPKGRSWPISGIESKYEPTFNGKITPELLHIKAWQR